SLKRKPLSRRSADWSRTRFANSSTMRSRPRWRTSRAARYLLILFAGIDLGTSLLRTKRSSSWRRDSALRGPFTIWHTGAVKATKPPSAQQPSGQPRLQPATIWAPGLLRDEAEVATRGHELEFQAAMALY